MFIDNPDYTIWCKENAYNTEPEGRICGYCNKPNDNYDDCGYWYICSKENPTVYLPACISCFKLHHPFHVSKHGCGER